MASFDDAITKLVAIEGGYADNPEDTPTNFGITLGTLQAWRKNPTLTARDVKSLTLDEAKAIYRALYWNVMNLDSVQDQRLAYVLFDQGVNFGPRIAVKNLQYTLINKFGIALVADGVIGTQTLKALNSVRTEQLLLEYVEGQEDNYAQIVVENPKKLVFLRGWLNRAHALLRLILS